MLPNILKHHLQISIWCILALNKMHILNLQPKKKKNLIKPVPYLLGKCTNLSMMMTVIGGNGRVDGMEMQSSISALMPFM
ncbi:MAG: hypothetical protein DM484_23190 [Candidatus Methylumidiphilus alinenensis]|uniref:Uncharacterized protein n=1 Tax=Candidatus Methylumidiphilus alinenensis TaxID=2202197 RepID=A0A2W4QLS4_9GAMM|nr:MAG: hypothetical protein DM484_23190 [Candidatus Methylumidiphilus alinenensis]